MDIPLEALEIQTQASGNLSIKLTDAVSWWDFPEYASTIAQILDAKIGKKADAIPERVWIIFINGMKYWIAFNDFALGVSLDSCDIESSSTIPDILNRLEQWKLEHDA